MAGRIGDLGRDLPRKWTGGGKDMMTWLSVGGSVVRGGIKRPGEVAWIRSVAGLQVSSCRLQHHLPGQVKDHWDTVCMCGHTMPWLCDTGKVTSACSFFCLYLFIALPKE
jgi:hypothetical protein